MDAMVSSEAAVRREHALSPAERQSFFENGFAGPFTLYEPQEIEEAWHKVRFGLLDKSRAPFPNSGLNYDRHLDVAFLANHVAHPKIVDRLQSILGDDILCWRSEMFTKNPGQAGTGWHQVETFVVGGTGKGQQQQQLQPTVRLDDVPVELTVWTAITPAIRDNGCMRFLPGSHRQWYYDEHRDMEYLPDSGENGDFFGYDYDDLKLDPNWTPDESKVATVECKAGQFIIFTAKCVHGSLGNTTRDRRLAYVSRYVPTSVRVYPGMQSFSEFGNSFELGRHTTVLVGGRDRYKHNRVVPARTLLK